MAACRHGQVGAVLIISESDFLMWWGIIGVACHALCYGVGGAFKHGIGWAMFFLVCPIAVWFGPLMLIEFFIIWLANKSMPA